VRTNPALNNISVRVDSLTSSAAATPPASSLTAELFTAAFVTASIRSEQPYQR
jgi:hypothetical protein